jgi:hypothetical protein
MKKKKLRLFMVKRKIKKNSRFIIFAVFITSLFFIQSAMTSNSLDTTKKIHQQIDREKTTFLIEKMKILDAARSCKMSNSRKLEFLS